jgi:hypothetical protein
VQDDAQESPQPGADETEIVSDGGKDDVSGVACATLEIAAAEMALALHVPDDGLDGRAASELAFDDAEHAAFLPGDEHAARVCGVVAAISLVDIAALDGAAGELFRGVENGAWSSRARNRSPAPVGECFFGRITRPPPRP